MSAHIDSEEEEALTAAMQMSLSSSNNAQEIADTAAAELELAAEIEREGSLQPQYHVKEEGSEWEEEMVPVPVNDMLLSQLIDMGFSDVRARKGLIHGSSMEGAISWLSEHEGDSDIDQPYMVKKSDTIPKVPLSAEEKTKKLEEVKNRIKQRREEKAKLEKSEEIRREKERRERGQKLDETIEERQRLMRKREAERLKREKEDAAKERARLKAEIARDKEVRKANKGVLPSVLGVDGYNPSIIQYNVPIKDQSDVSTVQPLTAESSSAPLPISAATSTASTQVAKHNPPLSSKKEVTKVSVVVPSDPTEKIEQCISTIMKYRTGGDGGQALKLLTTFIRNVVEHPEDVKFRSINTESNAFKTKIAPIVGALTLLKTVGFEKDEDGKLKYSGNGAEPLLKTALLKISEADALYKQMNPS